MAAIPYTTGLTEIGHGCYAWFEPPGSWGLANSGVVLGGDEVLVVDTQNDVARARKLRDAVRAVAGAREVGAVVNTHADGDHWFGNLFFEDARIHATASAAAQMQELRRDPRKIRQTASAAPGPALRDFLNWRADVFDYTDWRPVFPTDTFSAKRSISVGDTQVDLIPVGPAHTNGDAIVHVPERRVVFAGDIVFHRTTPMVWTGPVSNVVAACELILSLEPDVVVPGHGSAADPAGIRDLCDYLNLVHEHASKCLAAGASPLEAFESLDVGRYRLWAHGSRAYQAINAVYQELDPERAPVPYPDVMEVVLAHDSY